MSSPHTPWNGLADALLYVATLPRDLRRWPRRAARWKS